MKQQKKSPTRKKLPVSSIFMYIASAFITIVAVTLLVNNVLYFNNTISQYITQGYPYEMVAKELVPSQLIPGIFQPLGILGIAVVLYGTGLINQKITEYFRSCSDAETVIPTEPVVINKDNDDSSAAVPEQIESQTAEVQEDNIGNTEK